MNGFMQKASAAGWKKSNRIHHESSQHGYTMNAANQVMQPTNKDYRYARSTTTTPAMFMEAKFLKLRRCGKSGSSHKIRRRGAGIFSMDHIFLRRLRATWGDCTVISRMTSRASFGSATWRVTLPDPRLMFWLCG